MSTVQNLRKSLVRNWKPVRSLAGDALSGAEFAHFPLRLALTSPCLQQGMGLSTAGELFSGFGSVLCSASGPAVP